MRKFFTTLCFIVGFFCMLWAAPVEAQVVTIADTAWGEIVVDHSQGSKNTLELLTLVFRCDDITHNGFFQVEVGFGLASVIEGPNRCAMAFRD